jgi:hypothetical protein
VSIPLILQFFMGSMIQGYFTVSILVESDTAPVVGHFTLVTRIAAKSIFRCNRLMQFVADSECSIDRSTPSISIHSSSLVQSRPVCTRRDGSCSITNHHRPHRCRVVLHSPCWDLCTLRSPNFNRAKQRHGLETRKNLEKR